jgi:hypothetical protein
MNTLQQATAPVKPSLPGAIGFIAGLNIIGGIVMIILVFANHHNSDAAVFLLFAGLFSVLVGVGLVSLKRWALFAAIGGYILNILIGLGSLNPVAVLVPALILCHLCTAKSRAAFFAPPAPPALPRVTDAEIDVEADAKKF